MTTSKNARPSWRLKVTAVLAVAYAVVLAAVGVVVLYEFLAGAGAIGHKHLAGFAARGAVELSIVLLTGAGLLMVGAVRLVRARRLALLVWPLTVFLVCGCIGEVTDLVGTASGESNLVGAGILVLALIPILLVATDRHSQDSQNARRHNR